jgi:SAM-dependent methyltransferase
MGYRAYGIDFAEKTIKRIKQLFPDLKITRGDVRNLPFEENFFDAHWSLGVIEHFYDGFSETIKEMKRTLVSDGFVFITFPHMSILRRLKSSLNIYPIFVDNEKNKQLFYQFSFDENDVIRLFLREGFILKEKKVLDGFKGLKDEIKILRSILQKINDSPTLFSKIIRHFVSYIFSKFSSHIILLVFQLKENE